MGPLLVHMVKGAHGETKTLLFIYSLLMQQLHHVIKSFAPWFPLLKCSDIIAGPDRSCFGQERFFVCALFFVKWHPRGVEALGQRALLHRVIRAHRPLPVLLPRLKGLGIGIWKTWLWIGTIAQ